MDLSLDFNIAAEYHSRQQKIRIITENWVKTNMYCPRCGCDSVVHAANNSPVRDFYCENYGSEYELKSRNGSFGRKIGDGAYSTMIERITGNDNPDFFFMAYDKDRRAVRDFCVVPKHFFVPEIIERRRPLSPTARRAGWVGCNILTDKIPEQGKIAIVENGVCRDKQKVIEKLNRSANLYIDNISSRSWLFDVLNCVNAIQMPEFTLKDMYAFEAALSAKHPDNNNVKPKIRQQLQFLRDKGFIEFLGNGHYRKIN